MIIKDIKKFKWKKKNIFNSSDFMIFLYYHQDWPYYWLLLKFSIIYGKHTLCQYLLYSDYINRLRNLACTLSYMYDTSNIIRLADVKHITIAMSFYPMITQDTSCY
jgi:hypothetical protein